MKNVFSKPQAQAPWDRKWFLAGLAGVVMFMLFLLPNAFGGASDAVSSKVSAGGTNYSGVCARELLAARRQRTTLHCGCEISRCSRSQ